MPAPVFISHSSRDYAKSRTLTDALEGRGVKCWISERDIGAGDNYGDSIVEALERAQAMVLVFSENANNSEEIKKEIAIASQRKITVIPVRIEDVAPSKAYRYELATRNWIDLFADWDSGLQRLVDRIAAVDASIQPTPPPMQIPPPAKSSVWAYAAISVAMLTIVGIGGYSWLQPRANDNKVAVSNVPTTVEPAANAPGERTAEPPLTPKPKAAVAAPAATESAAPSPTPTPIASPTPFPTPSPSQMASSQAAEPTPAASAQVSPAASETPAFAAPAPIAPSPTPISASTPSPSPAPTAEASAEPNAEPTPTPASANSAEREDAAVSPIGPPPSNDAGIVFKECGKCPEMIVVPRGSAMLGSAPQEAARQSNESPLHEVDIAEPLAVGRFAVTFDEWDACLADGGCNARRPGDFGWGRGRQPVIFVSWNDADAYASWLKRKTGKPYRLLSEAEWEFVARGCKTANCPNIPFWFGPIRPEVAHYDSRFSYEGSPKANAPHKAAPVDDGAPNPFGLVNIVGNVRQWVADCWNPNPVRTRGSAAPRLTGDCASRSVKGGSWADKPQDLRAAARSWEAADEQSPNIGFRVARSLEP
jgi:formylglycine-generating enzyme required for sulfatase activity